MALNLWIDTGVLHIPSLCIASVNQLSLIDGTKAETLTNKPSNNHAIGRKRGSQFG